LQVSAYTPHAFGGVAKASVAYQTLKNPAKRRAYDESIGLERAPQPAGPADLWTGRPWSMRAGWVAGARPTGTSVPPRVPDPSPSREKPIIAATRPKAEEPGEAERRPASVAAPLGRPEPRAACAFAPRPALVQPAPEAIHLLLADSEDSGIDSKRTALIAAAAIAGVALFGGWLGWAAGNDGDDAPQDEVSEKLPQAVARTVSVIPVTEPEIRDRPEQAFQRSQRPATSVRPRPSPAPPPQSLALVDEGPQPLDAESVSSALSVDQPTAAATPVATGAAMPLSNRTIARTIERIGYSCGQVASTAATGSAGVYTVTCTSGQSYRAAPIRGRYRFRRM
ncbi:MAG: hypothetical protein ACREBM_05040, partial [Sphingomicrobium sp.]